MNNKRQADNQSLNLKRALNNTSLEIFQVEDKKSVLPVTRTHKGYSIDPSIDDNL